MRLKILFLTLTLLLISAKTTLASENWVIKNFDSNITIQSDGIIKIRETINVDFGNEKKHGIYRDFPTTYTYDDGSKRYVKSSVTEILIDSQKGKSHWSGIRLYLGNPDKTITGTHTYQLTYLVSGIVDQYEGYDELYWNVTGNSWEVPIETVKATVTLPTNAFKQVSCYQGPKNAADNCTGFEGADQATFNSSRPLGPGEGLTIAAGFNKDLVPIIRITPPDTTVPLISLVIAVIVFLITLITGLGIIFWLWWTRGRDYYLARKFMDDPSAKEAFITPFTHETIVVEFAPPENLRPGEIGALVDENAHTVDITATLIDLANRGFLKVTEIPKKWLFGTVDFELLQLKKDYEKILGFERELLNKLFDDRAKVNLSDLKYTFYKDLKSVKDRLFVNLTDKKYFAANPNTVKNKYIITGVLVTVVGGAITFLNPFVLILANSWAIIFSGFFAACALVGIFLIIMARFMPRKTSLGREMYRRSLGFRLFITTAETYRQQFFEKKNLFNDFLPYAIVFGVTKKYAQAFEKMGLEPPPPTWYVGSAAFNAMAFSTSMDSFASSVASTMASAPKSSGSGGGGFSGGGFGGGGGSW